MMRLTHPFAISARLLPALKIGDDWLSWSWAEYRFYLDTLKFEYTIGDFRAGPGSGTQACFAAILGFMSAAAESREHRMFTKREQDEDSNENLFPPHVVDWIMDNLSEIQFLEHDLEEGPQLIEEGA